MHVANKYSKIFVKSGADPELDKQDGVDESLEQRSSIPHLHVLVVQTDASGKLQTGLDPHLHTLLTHESDLGSKVATALFLLDRYNEIY